MVELYRTHFGRAYTADAMALLAETQSDSVDLIMTSPPFALQRKKEYGNEDENNYVDWIVRYGHEIRRVLKDSGSFVLDLGGAYRKGRPVRSLYNYRVLIRMCDECGFNLAEEFFWHNPAKLPSPIEWVNKRKIRAKDSVNTIWWFSKTDFPKADITRVLAPYSDRMRRLLASPESFYSPKKRPSGHDISTRFAADNGGSIPSNLLQFPNTDSNSRYLRLCKKFGAKRHPARFPAKLPAFFVEFLTDEGDLVMDIFAGSNTMGAVCEKRRRKWIACDLNREYLAASCFRFFREDDARDYSDIYEMMLTQIDGLPIDLDALLARNKLFVV